MSALTPFAADGHEVRWATWDGDHTETVTLQWDNEAWTVSGSVERERVEYVLRISPLWHVRQFMLFRDLEQPDLWLANDGHRRWGEVNGAHRPELDGCIDVELACTPFTASLPIRRLPLAIGDSADLPVVTVDVETLAVVARQRRYTRLDDHRWRIESGDDHDETLDSVEVDVDEHGLVIDHPERFRRLPA